MLTRVVRTKILGFCEQSDDDGSPVFRGWPEPISSRLRQLAWVVPQALNHAVGELVSEYRPFAAGPAREAAQADLPKLRSRCYQLIDLEDIADWGPQGRDGPIRWSASSAVRLGAAGELFRDYRRTLQGLLGRATAGRGSATLVTYRRPRPVQVNAAGCRLLRERIQVARGSNGGVRIAQETAYLLRLNLFGGQPAAVLRIVGTGPGSWASLDRLVDGRYAAGSVAIVRHRHKGWMVDLSWTAERLEGRVERADSGFVLVRDRPAQAAETEAHTDEEDAGPTRRHPARVAAFEVLAATVRRGSEPLAALEVAVAGCRHDGLRSALQEAIAVVRAGGPLSAALDRAIPPDDKPLLSRRGLDTIRAGEAGNRLAGALERVAEVVASGRASRKSPDPGGTVRLIDHDDLQPGDARVTGWWDAEVPGLFRVAYANPIVAEAPPGRGGARMRRDGGGVVVRGTGIAAVVQGLFHQFFAVSSDGQSMYVEGASVRDRLRRYKARRAELSAALVNLARCHRGRGRARRYAKLDQESRKWHDYATTRCRQNASRIARWCAARGVGRVLIADYEGVQERAEQQAADGEMPDQVRRMIRDWRHAAQRDAIVDALERYGIASQTVQTHGIARVCPLCGAERTPAEDRRFTCGGCGFSREVDAVEALNLIIDACAGGSVEIPDRDGVLGRLKIYGAGGVEDWDLQAALPDYRKARERLLAERAALAREKRRAAREAAAALRDARAKALDAAGLADDEKRVRARLRRLRRRPARDEEVPHDETGT